MRTTLKRLSVASVFSAAALLSFPSFAFAAESGPGISLLIPKMGEWIPMLIGFLVLWFILAKFGWPAFIGMIDKRQATIKDSLERAETAKMESERVLEENKAMLDDAKKQAAQIIADAKTTGDAVRAEMMNQAQEDARMLIEKANAAIEVETKVAIAQLQSSVADLSVSVAGRLIGNDLSDADHRRLIEHYLAEAGNLNAN